MFSFFQKQAEALEHWISFAEEFQFAPVDFPTADEQAQPARRFPGLMPAIVPFIPSPRLK